MSCLNSIWSAVAILSVAFSAGASVRIVVLALLAGGDLAVEVHRRVLLDQGRWGGERDPGRLSAPARELGGGQPPAQQAAGDQADQRPGLVPGLLAGPPSPR
jgi:hypothetical protein